MIYIVSKGIDRDRPNIGRQGGHKAPHPPNEWAPLVVGVPVTRRNSPVSASVDTSKTIDTTNERSVRSSPPRSHFQAFSRRISDVSDVLCQHRPPSCKIRESKPELIVCVATVGFRSPLPNDFYVTEIEIGHDIRQRLPCEGVRLIRLELFGLSLGFVLDLEPAFFGPVTMLMISLLGTSSAPIAASKSSAADRTRSSGIRSAAGGQARSPAACRTNQESACETSLLPSGPILIRPSFSDFFHKYSSIKTRSSSIRSLLLVMVETLDMVWSRKFTHVVGNSMAVGRLPPLPRDHPSKKARVSRSAAPASGAIA